MDVQKKLDEIVATVQGARSMPMSASCVVNRAELLALLDEVRDALPNSLAQAQELIGGREQMVEQARREAERIIEAAHAERGTIVSDTQIARQSQEEADRILAEARREAEEIRAEADEYVDSKLANFEVVLNKTIGSVDRGREKLLGRGPGLDEHGYPDQDAPEYSADPQTLIARADEYVDAKLGAFEAVLSKTLEAVGRGRQKLHGRIATDALGEHMAAQEGLGQSVHTSDADYLAGLAELADPEPVPAAPAPVAARIPAQQDPYAYQQQPQQADPYGYPQQDPYAYQQPQQADPYGYPQQDPYAYQQQPQPQPAALDETSFFDTSMIDLEQLRRYEQGQ
ncbi:ATP synthase F0 subunit B [Streptomyces sp. NPDC035033]|uniref:ATP synthase F0 subunit B n=1 Tax=Streptomyces sp. NPDC035033 TaxID=3155368 RepID=UPI0033DCA2FF